jgi:hypothetical protein
MNRPRSNRPHRMPSPESNPVPLIGPQIESFTVGSWCPSSDGSGKPEAVAISVYIAGLGDIVIRIKTPQELDRVVQMLLRHKRDVWPESG